MAEQTKAVAGKSEPTEKNGGVGRDAGNGIGGKAKTFLRHEG